MSNLTSPIGSILLTMADKTDTTVHGCISTVVQDLLITGLEAPLSQSVETHLLCTMV